MNKQTIIPFCFIALLLTFCVSFNSCGSDEDGVYNPKQQISKIYEDDSFSGHPKVLTQVWTWDKDKLNKIDYGWDNIIDDTYRYFYEKNKLVKIEQEKNGAGYILISYDGSKFKEIKSYNEFDEHWLTMNFVYDKNKISKITMELAMENSKQTDREKVLASFLPKDLASKMVVEVEKNRTKNDSDIQFSINYTYTKDNVKEMLIDIDYGTEGHETLTANYVSYDTKQNPFYKKIETGLYGDIMFHQVFGYSIVSSKNNPLEIRYKHGSIDLLTCKFTYTYDNKGFPTEILLAVYNENLADDPRTSKTYYEYK